MSNLKRLLILSNAPFNHTGYGIQTRHICQVLQELGYAVGAVALFGLQGNAIEWHGIPVFPTRHARFCLDVMDHYVRYFNADAVLSLYDLWAFPPETAQLMGAPWIPIVPVEGYPLQGRLPRLLRTASYVVAMSQFGQRTLEAAGIPATCIPHAIDTAVYQPCDRTRARTELGFPEERYVVTMVAMNKGTAPFRKGWVEMLHAWHTFTQAHPDAVFYAHTNRVPIAPSPDTGFQFDDLIEALGIDRHTLAFPDPTNFAVGAPDTEMAKIYSASDMTILPSYAEGFGLPVIESQACGTPIAAHDCSAMSELVVNGALIPQGPPHWIPERAYWWHRPRVADIVATMEHIYTAWQDPAYAQAQAAAGQAAIAAHYSLAATRENWARFLTRVGEELW